MANFGWNSKRAGALEAKIPGRKFRVAAYVVIVLVCWYGAGPIGLAWSSAAVVLIAPEVVEFWCWLARKAEAHAVDREERIYRFGYTDVRMLMNEDRPWFAAADIGAALGVQNLESEVRHFDAATCAAMGKGGERYLSESGVMKLAERSRHPDARRFRIWFSRDVMFPFNRGREAAPGRKAIG